jgi:hypothetical protein
MREAQMEALALENVGYATNADHGIAPKFCQYFPHSGFYAIIRVLLTLTSTQGQT